MDGYYRVKPLGWLLLDGRRKIFDVVHNRLFLGSVRILELRPAHFAAVGWPKATFLERMLSYAVSTEMSIKY
jgi:hypothetical protein